MSKNCPERSRGSDGKGAGKKSKGVNKGDWSKGKGKKGKGKAKGKSKGKKGYGKKGKLNELNGEENEEWWNEDDWWYDESGEVSRFGSLVKRRSGGLRIGQENGGMKEDQESRKEHSNKCNSRVCSL